MKLQRRLASSEVMAICAVFHLSGYRTFKWFYHKFFPNIVSYNHFVELMPYTALPMVFFAHPRCGEYTGISFTGFTTIDVCDI